MYIQQYNQYISTYVFIVMFGVCIIYLLRTDFSWAQTFRHYTSEISWYIIYICMEQIIAIGHLAIHKMRKQQSEKLSAR